MSLRSRPAALDPTLSLDQPLADAIHDAAAVGGQTRVSIDMRLYHPSRKIYVPWRGVMWKLDLPTVEVGRRLAEGIDLLVRALQLSPTVTLNTLREIVGGRYAITTAEGPGEQPTAVGAPPADGGDGRNYLALDDGADTEQGPAD